MKLLKNVLVGFLVSFIGSLPLGYLNIIGFELYEKSGMPELVYYLLGVVLIEAIVIYCTLFFAKKLMQNTKLLKYIELFSVFFLLLLAYVFYSQSQAGKTEKGLLDAYLNYNSFWVGIISSSLNFMQIPFWLGWNLYVVNAGYITTGTKKNLFYLLGTLIGTFAGIFSIVMILNYASEGTGVFSKYLLSHIIPLFFVAMAVYQGIKYYKKHH